MAKLSPPDLYRQSVDAVSPSNIDEALAYFAEDAVVVAGPACSLADRCNGKAAIRERYLSVLIKRRLPAPVSDQRYDGVRFRTRGEPVRLVGPDGAVVRLMGSHSFEFVDGHIASLRFALDTSDPATADFVTQAAAASRLARLDTR